MPGTKPFFEALWAVFRLQVIPESLGGAGTYRIDWEFDDAVFKEAAGKDFMLEAIDVLKGVLAFEEIASSRSPTSHSHKMPPESIMHARSQSQPLPSDQEPLTSTTITQQKRTRAPSDPFLDTPPPLRLATSYSSRFSGNTTIVHDGAEELSGPIFEDHVSPSSRGDFILDDSDEEYMRIWTSPDLPNTELLELLKVFPSFVSRRPLPRFPPSSPRHGDIEEGDEEGLEGKQIHFGTGSMWVSSKPRSDWNMGWWTRFLSWWRRIFC